jgi:amidase
MLAVIEWEPISIPEMDEILFRILNADGGDGVKQIVSIYDEPIIKEIDMPDDSWKLSVAEFWSWNSKKNALRQRYIDAWQATSKRTTSGQPIDGLIMPSGGHVAPPHGSMTYLMYEAISNMLDWTCTTIPVGFVDNEVDKPYRGFKSMSKYDKENYRKCKFSP